NYASSATCQIGAHPDMFYVSERKDRIRFWYVATRAGYDEYTAGPGIPLRLRFDAKVKTWTLDDGSGITYRFDPDHGTLSDVVHLTRHVLHVDWTRSKARFGVIDDGTTQAPLYEEDQGGRIDEVLDTT